MQLIENYYKKLNSLEGLSKFIIWICAIALIYSFFPYHGLHDPTASPELTWHLICNVANLHGFKFGRDVFFEYGPLNFIIYPYAIGNQLITAQIVYTFVYAVFGVCIYKLVKQLSYNLLNAGVMLLVVLMLYGHNITFETFMVFTQLLLLYFVFFNNSRKAAVLFTIIYAPLFLVKILPFAESSCLIVLYSIFAYKLKKDRVCIYILLSGFVFTLIGYLIYNPSVTDLIEYIQSIYYKSQGQQIDHTYDKESSREWTIIFVPLVVIALWGFIYSIYQNNKEKAYFSIIIASFLFFAYKEGFVRHSGYYFFEGIAILFSVYLLTLNFKTLINKKKQLFLICFAFISLLKIVYSYLSDYMIIDYQVLEPKSTRESILYSQNGLHWLARESLEHFNFEEPRFPLKIYNQIKSVFTANSNNTGASFLSPDTREKLKEKSFTSFYDGTFIVTEKNFKPLPGFNLHNSYHPYIEQKNYDFLMGKNAPDYLTYQFNYNDERIMNLEAPATLNAIRLNYEDSFNGLGNNNFNKYSNYQQISFLKKKEKPSGLVANDKPYKVTKPNYLGTFKIEKEADFMSIEYKFSILGELARFFWKIPQIKASIMYTKKITNYNGELYTENTKRYNEGALVIDNLKTPFPLSYLVLPEMWSIFELQNIQEYKNNYELMEFQIDPEVLKLFSEINVKWYKAHEI
ncbi:MAG: hypothetical protein U0M61_00105 [Succinivibrio sp.]|nr:hypothetical protein [Succinivibrio sp.]